MGPLVPDREASGPVEARGGIGPGLSGPFGPGWWDKPGPMGLAPGPPPLVPVGGLNRDQRLCDTPKFLIWFSSKTLLDSKGGTLKNSLSENPSS